MGGLYIHAYIYIPPDSGKWGRSDVQSQYAISDLQFFLTDNEHDDQTSILSTLTLGEIYNAMAAPRDFSLYYTWPTFSTYDGQVCAVR